MVTARNLIKAKPGDIVKIEIAGKSGLSAALIIFGIPIALALIGLIISTGLGEIYTILISISGLIIGLIIAKIIDRMAKSRRNFIPRIVDKES